MAIMAYQIADCHRRATSTPTSGEERCGIPVSFMKRIWDTVLAAQFAQLRFIRTATAIFVSFMFFEHGETGASLSPHHIKVTPQAVHLTIPLRKNGPIRTPHTLTYRRADPAAPSPLDLITR
jgi:hypothetical protein